VAKLDAPARARRLNQKTRHNLATISLLLARGLMVEFVAIYLMGLAELSFGTVPALAAAALAAYAFMLAFDVFLEHASLGFRRMSPQVASGYDRAFWEVERYWKLSSAGPLMSIFAGTPFRPMILRLTGAKVGANVFDDGVNLTERSLVEIGDGAALNQNTILQSHSLEEGAYKSDFIRIGAGCTLGVGAFVHYGVTMGARSRLDPDAFLMKGEIAPPDTRWRGNPARLVGRRAETAYAIAAE
jgi:non-ribosomal peptide synthetase-like protein